MGSVADLPMALDVLIARLEEAKSAKAAATQAQERVTAAAASLETYVDRATQILSTYLTPGSGGMDRSRSSGGSDMIRSSSIRKRGGSGFGAGADDSPGATEDMLLSPRHSIGGGDGGMGEGSQLRQEDEVVEAMLSIETLKASFEKATHKALDVEMARAGQDFDENQVMEDDARWPEISAASEEVGTLIASAAAQLESAAHPTMDELEASLAEMKETKAEAEAQGKSVTKLTVSLNAKLRGRRRRSFRAGSTGARAVSMSGESFRRRGNTSAHGLPPPPGAGDEPAPMLGSAGRQGSAGDGFPSVVELARAARELGATAADVQRLTFDPKSVEELESMVEEVRSVVDQAAAEAKELALLRIACATSWTKAGLVAKSTHEKIAPCESTIAAAAAQLAQAADMYQAAEDKYEAAKADAHAESERLEAELNAQLEAEERQRQAEAAAAEKAAAEEAKRRQQEEASAQRLAAMEAMEAQKRKSAQEEQVRKEAAAAKVEAERLEAQAAAAEAKRKAEAAAAASAAAEAEANTNANAGGRSEPTSPRQSGGDSERGQSLEDEMRAKALAFCRCTTTGWVTRARIRTRMARAVAVVGVRRTMTPR